MIPCHSRRTEDIERALGDLAEQVGAPICVIADGASELHQGVKNLENRGLEVMLLDDIKHKAANILKRLLKTDDRFAAFESRLGRTTADIQQTELDHFLPPKKRTKCRFMNLGKLIDWANMVMHHHRDREAAGRKGISPDRFEQKLGWLREFDQDLQQWTKVREVMSAVLTFTNVQGVYAGSVDELKKKLVALEPVGLAGSVMESLLACCQANEQKLLASQHAALRLPCSTEVLESSLASYKYIQKHHIRGTFTSLLATYPTLFSASDPPTLKLHLAQVTTKLKNSWLRKNKLNNSTQTRKTKAYKAALGLSTT